MTLFERSYGVWLHRTFVGTLYQRGDYTRFSLHPSYTEDPARPVLGLVFEQDLDRVHAAALRLPPWFSNLLPEGLQRSWIARQRDVSEQREMELLGEVGGDLPGAVTVLPIPGNLVGGTVEVLPTPQVAPALDEGVDPRGRFSLAGVQLKLSMVAAGDRLVIPMGGTLGDWIVKFPDAALPRLPLVEFVTMELARAIGIQVPETRLMSRADLPDTPSSLWAPSEDEAYAIKRFDRGPDRSLIHIEDFAQVRDIYPSPADFKYRGSYEGLATLVYRGWDEVSLRELVRRLVFNVLVDNSDAHLKNFSLLYADPRRPVLSPAYDLVSVAPYSGFGGETALSLNGTRRAEHLRVRNFERLNVHGALPKGDAVHLAEETVAAVVQAWPALAERYLIDAPGLFLAMQEVIQRRAASLLAR